MHRAIAIALVCATTICLAPVRPACAQRAGGIGRGGAIRYAGRVAGWGYDRDDQAWNAGFERPPSYQTGPKEIATVSPSVAATPVRTGPRPGSVRNSGPDVPPAYGAGGDPFWDLVRMSDYLNEQQQLTLWIDMASERAAESGQKIQLASRHITYVRRPNNLALDISTDKSHIRVVYTGSGATVIDTTKNIYGTIPVQGDVETVVHTLATDYGMGVPADDLLYKGDYSRLESKLRWANDLGRETIDGRRCYHSVFSSRGVDVQTWVESRERPVPRRVVIINNNLPGRPRRTLDITRCEIGPIPDSVFRVDVPAGAQQIEIAPQR